MLITIVRLENDNEQAFEFYLVIEKDGEYKYYGSNSEDNIPDFHEVVEESRNSLREECIDMETGAIAISAYFKDIHIGDDFFELFDVFQNSLDLLQKAIDICKQEQDIFGCAAYGEARKHSKKILQYNIKMVFRGI